MIPYGRQDISDADIQAVVDVLRSDFITQGPAVPAFEQMVAGYCGARRAVAANSATSALHLACRALEVGPGDRVWTSPVTFVASANCALYCGAGVDFVDVEPATGNMSVAALAEMLADAETHGQLPKVVIPVHLSGTSCDMRGIAELAKRYGFRVIEDASHAIGGRYEDSPVGSCTHSDITVFSFHPVKIVTTGEGGMALTNDDALAERMELLRSHGITRDPALMDRRPDGPWYYQQVDLGFNYRMTDIQAALGCSQMQRVDEFVLRRNEIAAMYDEGLADCPVDIPPAVSAVVSARHLYVIRVRLNEVLATRLDVFDALRAHGIGVNLHYIPIYRQPFHARSDRGADRFPGAEEYYARAISIPMFPTLTASQLEDVVSAVRSACEPSA